MSIIHCTQSCVYQNDGYCTMETAGGNRNAAPNDFCVNFTPREQIDLKPEPPEPDGYF